MKTMMRHRTLLATTLLALAALPITSPAQYAIPKRPPTSIPDIDNVFWL